jgi:chemotaxis protein CheY-P-specific phosphatase CheC
MPASLSKVSTAAAAAASPHPSTALVTPAAPLQHAALVRLEALLNQGIISAAEIINDVVRTPLLLAPPVFAIRDFEFHTGEEAMNIIEPNRQYRISLVSANFGTAEQPAAGSACVYFSSDRAAKLALLLLTDDTGGTDMDSLRNSVFLEIGSILLSGILECLHERGVASVFSMMTYTETISDDIFAVNRVTEQTQFAAMQLDCMIESHTIQGRALVAMPNDAWQRLSAVLAAA